MKSKLMTIILGFICVLMLSEQTLAEQTMFSNNFINHKDCTLPTPIRSEAAFKMAKKSLSYQRCRIEFGQIFDQLLEISADHPGDHNLRYFAEFIVWNKNRGIISNRQATNLFNSYFGEVFIGLPEHGSICHYLSNNNSLAKLLNKELKQKKKGYVDVLGKTELYDQIYANYQQISFVLEMTKTACNS